MLQDFETILISLPTTIAIWQKRQTELALTDSLNFPLEKIANIWHAYQQFSIEKFEAMLEIAKHDYTLFDLDLTFAIHSDVNVDSSEFDKILDYVNKLKNEPIFTLEQKKSNLNLLCLYANALLPAYFIFVQTWAQSFQAMLPGIQKKYEAELIAQVKTNFLDKLFNYIDMNTLITSFEESYVRLANLQPISRLHKDIGFPLENINHFFINRFQSTAQPSLLENLPIQITENGLSPYLSTTDLSRLVRSSKTAHQLFFKPLKINQVMALLKFVRKANYDAAEKVVIVNPKLMFIEYNSVSPLSLAFRNFDTYMWQLFFKQIEHDENDVKRFLQQAYVQKDFLDLQPLLEKYDAYYRIYHSHNGLAPSVVSYSTKSPEEEKKEIQLWQNLGKSQLELLPWHILREFYREGKNWKKKQFDANIVPRPASDMNLVKKLTEKLGIEFHLVRGELYQPRQDDNFMNEDKYEIEWSWLDGSISEDIKILSALYKTRIEEYQKQIAELENRFANRKVRP